MMRKDGRGADELRPMTIDKDFLTYAAGSRLIVVGQTRVLCAVSVEEDVPTFLRDKEQGWITAEYGMLPCATHTRNPREAVRGQKGRTLEIQRLIGRTLRAMVDLTQIGKRTFRIDCDVLQADGGTRTASVTGAALALADALHGLVQRGALAELPPILPVAAVSVGIVAGEPFLDLDYEEDSQASVDANFVMTGQGEFVEIQSTGESRPFTEEEFLAMTRLARKGIDQMFGRWW